MQGISENAFQTILSRINVVLPEEEQILVCTQRYTQIPLTQQHIQRQSKGIMLRLLPSKKQTIIEKAQEILEELRRYNIHLEYIQ